MDFDLDEPEDAIFVLAVLDDEEATAARTAHGAGAPQRTGRGGGGSGCAGCGCMGCLIPLLVIAAATAAGFGALPFAAVLGLAALVLALLDRPHR